MEGRVEHEVPDQGEGGELVGPGEEEEGRLGLQQAGDDGSWVAVEKTHDVEGQGVGPTELMEFVSESEPGGSTEDDTGRRPECWEDRGGENDISDSLPH